MERAELTQDALHDFIRCNGQENALSDRELRAYTRLWEEDEMIDESYKVLLVSLLSEVGRLSEPQNEEAVETKEAMEERIEAQKKRKNKEDFSSGKDCEPERKSSSSTKPNPGNDQTASSGKDIPVGKPNDCKADEQRNVVSKKTKNLMEGEFKDAGVTKKARGGDEKSVLGKEFRNVIMEEFSDEDERVVTKNQTSHDSRNAIIHVLSDSDEEREVAQCSSYNCKNVVKNSRNKKGAIKKFPSSESRNIATKNRKNYEAGSGEFRNESDADTEDDDDDDKSENSDMEFRNVGKSSQVAPIDSEVEFRRQVLDVMSKPYDKTEYTNIKKKFDSGLYTSYHPELGDELDRCKRRKRLALMRGFYFWIQDVAREGAFMPWRDEECLAVNPAPPVSSPLLPPPPSSDRRAKPKLVGESSRVVSRRSEVEFRRRVLEVILEPYEMVEYMIVKNEFDTKCNTDYHPELGNELMKCRDNLGKHLALMRGFFFWINNLNKKGAFKPWTDLDCLSAEPEPLLEVQ